MQNSLSDQQFNTKVSTGVWHALILKSKGQGKGSDNG